MTLQFPQPQRQNMLNAYRRNKVKFTTSHARFYAHSASMWSEIFIACGKTQIN